MVADVTARVRSRGRGADLVTGENAPGGASLAQQRAGALVIAMTIGTP